MATLSIIQEELEAVRRKPQERKDQGLAGLYTDRPGKRKAGESPEVESKKETKTRRGSRQHNKEFPHQINKTKSTKSIVK